MPLPAEYLFYPHRQHGLDNPRHDWDPADRRAPIALSSRIKSIATIIVPVEFFPLAVFPKATTWMSPARNASYRTLDLLAEAGFEICLNWEADQRPLPFKTNSKPIWSLPHYGELGDFKLLIDRSQSEEDWQAQITETAAYHIALHEKEGASAWAFTLTPYVLGQPFRMQAVKQTLDALTAMDGLALMTAGESCAAFQEVMS